MVAVLPGETLRVRSRAILRAVLTAALALAGTAAWARPPEPARQPAAGRLLLLPLHDLTGGGEGAAWLTERLRERLAARGFELVGDAELARFLRERRWRARHALSSAQLRELAERFDARYLFSGVLRAWAKEQGAHVALSARITDAADGGLIWFDSVSLHRAGAPGLLPSLRRLSLEALAERALDHLLSSLEVRQRDGLEIHRGKRVSGMGFGTRPVVYRRENSRPGPWKVAVLPIVNHTRRPEGPAIVAEHVIGFLLARHGVEVVAPGDLQEALMRTRIQPLYGVGPEELRRLGEALAVDAVVDGVLFAFEDAPAKVPRVDLSLRIREVPSGQILWMGALAAHGEQTRWIYDLGCIRDADRLAERVVSALLGKWRP